MGCHTLVGMGLVGMGLGGGCLGGLIAPCGPSVGVECTCLLLSLSQRSFCTALSLVLNSICCMC